MILFEKKIRTMKNTRNSFSLLGKMLRKATYKNVSSFSLSFQDV